MSIMPFNFEGKELRTLTDENGEVLFVAKDVAEMLGYKDTVNTIKQHCKGVAKRHPIIDSLGRTQEVRVIYEPDVWRLIINSHLPTAQKIETWIFEEVLPTIRKTGKYNMADNDDIFEELAQTKEALFMEQVINRNQIKTLEVKIDSFEQDKQKAEQRAKNYKFRIKAIKLITEFEAHDRRNRKASDGEKFSAAYGSYEAHTGIDLDALARQNGSSKIQVLCDHDLIEDFYNYINKLF